MDVWGVWETGGMGAVEVAATQRGFQAEMSQNGWKRVNTCPKWPQKVRLTLPKGRGPLLKISIFGEFGPISAPPALLAGLLKNGGHPLDPKPVM